MFSLESYRIRIVLLVSVCALLVSLGMTKSLEAVFLFEFNWKKTLYVLVAFFILALLVERCVEVLVNFLFVSKETEISAPFIKAVSHAQMQTQVMTDSLSRLGTPEEKTALLNSAVTHDVTRSNQSVVDEFDVAVKEMLKLKVPKAAVAILIACLIGLVISASGFRVLTTLMCSFQGTLCESGDITAQSSVFRTADLLVSSLLLAGGADGIHGIIRRIFGPSSDLNIVAKRIGLTIPA